MQVRKRYYETIGWDVKAFMAKSKNQAMHINLVIKLTNLDSQAP